jgi:hypothetical protein
VDIRYAEPVVNEVKSSESKKGSIIFGFGLKYRLFNILRT